MDRQKLLDDIQSVEKDGIAIVEAPTFQKANETLAKILYKYSDAKSALFLSGGSTPKRLYEYLAKEKKMSVGAVVLIDERYGNKNHRHSNELMIRDTGLINYIEDKNVRFYPILQEKNLTIEDATSEYDEALRFVFEYFPKNIGILGLGEDGHTAGIPAIEEIATKILDDQSGLVDYYGAKNYGERITMNFQALSMMDLILILVLGKDKREALKLMFDSGKVEEVPARFYIKPEIASKTILITDQII